ncbi:hypothetical protein BOTBODRAFT_62833 [Botryobasidium botryosum FD-172 SS1]|uniref:F-box domain-containing protein n=1 Tax=Botryobasidium botryosum (strain FD-172 SS1) TaxID=930990 RepID=A0A067N6R5_BOTB1|nr:hypothetical protein BOTBODRAFT_62833 [Botryobasidium botryosum FD-172 SS1]
MSLSIPTLVTSLFQALLDRIQLDCSDGDPPAHKSKSLSLDLAAEARAALDQEIKMIQLTINTFKDHADRLLSAIRHRRNQHAPIHRLPPEMISLIFELAGPGTQRRNLEYRDPLNIMRVSRDWRQIAMDSPRVWAHISMIPEPLLSTFLERSKNVPLELTFYRTTRGAALQHMARISPSHLERTRVLRIDLSGMEMQIDKVESWLSTPLSALERLEINRPEEEMYHGGLNFAIDAPRLRHLSFEHCFMPFDHPIYSTLSTLTLRNIAFIETDVAVGLLQALEASLFLEELSLQYQMYSAAATEPTLSNPMMVNLPHLRRLSLGIPSPITRFFLGHITTPASSQTELVVTDRRPYDDIASIIPSQPGNLLNITATTELLVSARDGGANFEAKGRSCKSGGSFWLIIFGERGLAHGLFESLAHVVPMPHLQTLSVHSFKKKKKDTGSFARALGHFPSITTLEFKGCHPTVIESVTISRARNRHICPLLQNLSLSDCSIKEGALLRLVRSRTFFPDDEPSTTGRPLERLDLVSCWEPTRDVVPKLLEHLKVVYWGAQRFKQVEAETTGVDDSQSA